MVAAPARADLPADVTITWSGDNRCPRPFALDAEVSQLLGGKRQLPPTELELHVEYEDGAYELTLEVESGRQRGERTVRLSTCEEAQDAAVVLIATAIDPDAVLRVSKPSPPPPPPPPPKVEAPAPPRDVPFYRWSLLLQALFDTSSLPGPTVGPSLGVLWQQERWRFWADVHYLAPRTEHDDTPDELRIRLDMFAAGLGGAYVWTLGPMVLGPAVELEAGVLRARDLRGPRVIDSRDRNAAWSAVAIGAVAAYGVTKRVGIELGVYAGLPFQRPQLGLGGPAVFYTTEWATMRLALSVRVSLGSP